MDRDVIERELERLIAEYPICEYTFGDTTAIPFSDKIFTICETDCRRYGHSWACPPHAGTVEENIRRVMHYRRFLVYSTVTEVTDAFDLQACMLARPQHEVIARAFRQRVREHFGISAASLQADPTPPIHFLSAGCCYCESCACPDEPCRAPGERMMSMESHGILIMKLVDDCGMTYSYDSRTVVYFSMLLY